MKALSFNRAAAFAGMVVRLTLVWILVAAGIGAASAEVPVPQLAARVTDLTGTLTADQSAALEGQLAAFEAKKGSQIVVLVVPTTQAEAIEQYSIRVAEAWKIGRKGVDDGVILLVAKDDRKLRIEVGYGLEGALPDAIAKRIIDEIILPRFRDGDFYGGISAGVDRIIRVVEGEPLPAPRRTQSGDDPIGGLLGIGLVVLVLGRIVAAGIGKFQAATIVGGTFGVIAWFILGFALAAGIAAVLMFVLALAFYFVRGSGGGWTSGSGGWSSGGGSFGGGGFSGGGGGFGGGGASGGW